MVELYRGRVGGQGRLSVPFKILVSGSQMKKKKKISSRFISSLFKEVKIGSDRREERNLAPVRGRPE